MQDHLPVKFQDAVLKCRHERFVRIEHSIICLQSIFSFVEIIIELFAKN